MPEHSERPNWLIEDVDYDHPDAERLRGAQRTELAARYGSDDHEPGQAPTSADITVFLIARDENGTAIACGGLRPVRDDELGADVVEVKRMYTVPDRRGSGVATAVLNALKDRAATTGARLLVLETGTLQPDAIRFYKREGFTQVPLYGPYVNSRESLCFARTLQ